MSRNLLALLALSTGLSAQEANSGFEVSVTASAQAVGTEMLTEAPRNGVPEAAGFRVVAYPTWKLDDHWTVTAALDANSQPYLYQEFYTPGYHLHTEVLQASLAYSTLWNQSNSLVIRAGDLPSAFGSFLLRYDDAVNPLIDIPLSYGYYDAGVTTKALAGAQADLTLGRVDMRAQFTGASAQGRYGGWTGGAGYTIRQGFRVGVSAYRSQGAATGYGVDLQWGHGPWNLNGELQRFQWTDMNQAAGYGEVRRVLSPRWYVAARLGGLRQDEYGSRQVWETAVGYRPGVHELVKFGYEMSQDTGGRDHVLAVQFVTQFRPVAISRD